MSMMPIDPSEFQAICNDTVALMPNTCDILRPGTPSRTDRGGVAETYSPIAVGVPCAFFPASSLSALGMDFEQTNKPVTAGQWAILLPNGQDITVRDRIAIIESGQLFEVVTSDGLASFSAQVSVKATLVE